MTDWVSKILGSNGSIEVSAKLSLESDERRTDPLRKQLSCDCGDGNLEEQILRGQSAY